MNPRHARGMAAEGQVAGMFAAAGYQVLLPAFNHQLPYDLVVDRGDKLLKIQIKQTGRNRVDLRRQRRAGIPYAAGDYDYLVVEHRFLGVMPEDFFLLVPFSHLPTHTWHINYDRVITYMFWNVIGDWKNGKEPERKRPVSPAL